jgi:hypothetical protein
VAVQPAPVLALAALVSPGLVPLQPALVPMTGAPQAERCPVLLEESGLPEARPPVLLATQQLVWRIRLQPSPAPTMSNPASPAALPQAREQRVALPVLPPEREKP